MQSKWKTSCLISAPPKDRRGAIPTGRIPEDETSWVTAAPPSSSFAIIPSDLPVGTGRHRSF